MRSAYIRHRKMSQDIFFETNGVEQRKSAFIFFRAANLNKIAFFCVFSSSLVILYLLSLKEYVTRRCMCTMPFYLYGPRILLGLVGQPNKNLNSVSFLMSYSFTKIYFDTNLECTIKKEIFHRTRTFYDKQYGATKNNQPNPKQMKKLKKNLDLWPSV